MQLHMYTPTYCVLSGGECIDAPVLPAWLEFFFFFFFVSPCLNLSAIVSAYCGAYVTQFLTVTLFTNKIVKNTMLPIHCM